LHRIKNLKSKAEDIDTRLVEAWPRDNRIARRRFELLSRAYVEARYSASYEITKEELHWLTERVKVLQDLVERICREQMDQTKDGWRRSMWRSSSAPWIHEDNASALKILNIARHDCETVHKRRRGNDRIGLIAAVRNM